MARPVATKGIVSAPVSASSSLLSGGSVVVVVGAWVVVDVIGIDVLLDDGGDVVETGGNDVVEVGTEVVEVGGMVVVVVVVGRGRGGGLHSSFFTGLGWTPCSG